MPATRSRASTEQAEVATEEVKKVETGDIEPEKVVDEIKDSELAAGSSDDSQEETNATSTEDKVAEVPVVEEQNGNSEAESHVEHANGADKPVEEEIESIKRKSIEGEGDGPDSTEVTPKKAKLSEEEEVAPEGVDDDGVVPVVEAV